ncbi:MAG: hypothetical protein KGM16_05415 [Bacteroidota bacterium]|nr:hypothetical protein [Bacteroidota bacterium]
MDYNILTTDGNIAFYKSCEVTELFLYRKADNAIFNFFTIAVFEEKPFTATNETFLSNKPIKVNDEYSIGIKRFWLSMQDADNNFQILKTQNKWKTDGSNASQFPQLKFLPKQFIPSIEGNRINNILKNNFNNGSYILEFFDESKDNLDFLLKVETINKLNELIGKIKQTVPIDLSVVRDRIGNFIFQFPVTILETNSTALKTWDGVDLNFSWHTSIQTPPDCLLQVESTIDKNYMGSIIVDYNKTQNQKVNIGNLDQINDIKFWRKEPSLILSTFHGTYIREFDFRMGIINPEPRLFEVAGNMVEVQIISGDRDKKKPEKTNYTNYISNNLYDAEKKQLEKSLSFKQYKKGLNGGLNDLQKLIKQKDENGVFLWDPFLSSTDILQTLYYSAKGGVPLKAIGSVNDAVKNVYHFKGKSIADVIADYKAILENPNNNNHHLNLEFRIQHGSFGWAFHDRFLIFPSSELRRSQVYSLGTSLNSYGKSHHILHEVSHPQPVVDAFNELWDELNKPESIVWKFPK